MNRINALRRRPWILFMMALATTGFWLGCGGDPRAANEANFARAINATLKEHNPAGMAFPVTFPYLYSEGGSWGVKKQELDALTKAGMLTTRPTTTERFGGFGQPKTQVPAVEYSLSEEGKKCYNTVSMGGLFRQNGFLFGTAEVDKVMNFAEINGLGVKGVEVKYTYRFTNLAKWAEDPQLQSDLPALAEAMKHKESSTPQTILLQLTNNGWAPGL